MKIWKEVAQFVVIILCCIAATAVTKVDTYDASPMMETTTVIVETTTVLETTTIVETTTEEDTSLIKTTTARTTKLATLEDEYGRYYLFNASVTAYCPCAKCCGKHSYNRPVDENGDPIIYTSSGVRAMPGYTLGMSKEFAYGTKVFIPGVGMCEVQDRGGAVKGNVIDLFCATHEEACKWGRKSIQVKIYY